MLVPLSTGVLKVAEKLGIPPGYIVKINRLGDVVTGIKSISNVATASVDLHLVGKQNDKYYNLFAFELYVDVANGKYEARIAFRGDVAELQDKEWYYLNPGTSRLYVKVDEGDLSTITNDTVYEVQITGRTLTVRKNGKEIFSTDLLKDPITLDEVWSIVEAKDSTGSDLSASNFAMMTFDIINVPDFSIVMPVILGVAAAAAVASVIITFLSRIAR